MILSWSMIIRRRNGRRLEIVVKVLDVSRAHFHLYVSREAYIELPPEDAEEGMVGLLLRTMYGTRDAAAAFDRFATEVRESSGYITGASTPCVYRHCREPSVGWRHGDDIILAGEPHFVDQMVAEIEVQMRIKVRATMGFRESDERYIAILNRLLSLEVIGGKRVL